MPETTPPITEILHVRLRLRGRTLLIILLDLALTVGALLALCHSVHLALIVVEWAMFLVTLPHAWVTLAGLLKGR